MENLNMAAQTEVVQAPPLALPDAESARRMVGRWLRTEIGDALYPAEVSFVRESFAWHVAVWFGAASQPLAALVADVYLNAVTGAFLGKPSRETLARRLNQALVSQG
jgi:hypothetical protein